MREGSGSIEIDHFLQRVPDQPVSRQPRVAHLRQVLPQQVHRLAPQSHPVVNV